MREKFQCLIGVVVSFHLTSLSFIKDKLVASITELDFEWLTRRLMGCWLVKLKMDGWVVTATGILLINLFILGDGETCHLLLG